MCSTQYVLSPTYGCNSFSQAAVSYNGWNSGVMLTLVTVVCVSRVVREPKV